MVETSTSIEIDRSADDVCAFVSEFPNNNAFRVVELGPGRSVTFTSTSGTFPLTITRSVEPLGAERSRFTEHARGEPGGFSRIAAPLLRPLVRASIKRDLPRLKRLLEASRSG